MECLTCNNEFDSYKGVQRYCCVSCRDQARVKRRDPIKMKEYREKSKQRATISSTKEYARNYHLKRTFGITLDEYNSLLEQQGGGCAICGKTPEEEKRSLAVDHDHKTGEIFGILCWFCNHKLVGRIRDSKMFERAANYLSKGTGLIIPPKKKRKKNARRPRRKD